MDKDYEFCDTIDLSVYNQFRESVGWGKLPEDQARITLDHSVIKMSCIHKGQTVAIARLLWDFGYTAYLADVIVKEEYRGKGLGKALVTRVLAELKSRIKEGWRTKVILLAAKGKEDFYTKFGFVARPNENEGCGMTLLLSK